MSEQIFVCKTQDRTTNIHFVGHRWTVLEDYSVTGKERTQTLPTYVRQP